MRVAISSVPCAARGLVGRPEGGLAARREVLDLVDERLRERRPLDVGLLRHGHEVRREEDAGDALDREEARGQRRDVGADGRLEVRAADRLPAASTTAPTSRCSGFGVRSARMWKSSRSKRRSPGAGARA